MYCFKRSVKTHSPETPLTIAAIKGYVKVANYLLSKGASKEKAIECSDDHEKPLVTGFFHELERISRFRPKLESKRHMLEAQMLNEKPETLPTTTKGITIAGLKKMSALIESECEAGRFKDDMSFPDGTECKGTMVYKELTTTDIVYRYVKDISGDRRLADSGVMDLKYFTIPSLFISHAWRGRFSVLIDQVLAYAERESLTDDYGVWMDMWAVNQLNDQIDEVGVAFMDVVQTCLDGTLVVCDLDKCETYSRAWCLFEWDWTMWFHGREELKFVGLATGGQAWKGIKRVDVNKAECFKVKDKEMILGEVLKKHGTAEKFNEKIIIKLEDIHRTLNPSYRRLRTNLR